MALLSTQSHPDKPLTTQSNASDKEQGLSLMAILKRGLASFLCELSTHASHACQASHGQIAKLLRNLLARLFKKLLAEFLRKILGDFLWTSHRERL
jgi:hypothetical protein